MGGMDDKIVMRRLLRRCGSDVAKRVKRSKTPFHTRQVLEDKGGVMRAEKAALREVERQRAERQRAEQLQRQHAM